MLVVAQGLMSGVILECRLQHISITSIFRTYVLISCCRL